LARRTRPCILSDEAITATVLGLTTLHEVDNTARASYTRQLGMTSRENEWPPAPPSNLGNGFEAEYH